MVTVTLTFDLPEIKGHAKQVFTLILYRTKFGDNLLDSFCIRCKRVCLAIPTPQVINTMSE